jgi:hypothetical protein
MAVLSSPAALVIPTAALRRPKPDQLPDDGWHFVDKYLGLEVDLDTPPFVASRVVGWAAHVIEQSENNRLIRPRSKYTGPAPRAYVPLEDRG